MVEEEDQREEFVDDPPAALPDADQEEVLGLDNILPQVGTCCCIHSSSCRDNLTKRKIVIYDKKKANLSITFNTPVPFRSLQLSIVKRG